MTEQIEEPMNMNYRESVAWQKGWGIGFKADYEKAREEIKDKIKYFLANHNFKYITLSAKQRQDCGDDLLKELGLNRRNHNEMS